jgi:hypothetical protein
MTNQSRAIWRGSLFRDENFGAKSVEKNVEC